jgi:hypothetical protein
MTCEQCKTDVRQLETAAAMQLPLRFFYVVLRVCVATLLRSAFVRRINPWQVEQ